MTRQTVNPEKNRAQERMWRQKNPDKRKLAIVAWHNSHKDEMVEYQKGYRQRVISDQARDTANRKARERRARDPGHRMLRNLRLRVSHALCGRVKSARTRLLLGMEIPEFKIYLQGQFQPGMTWENYGPVWHVDHIRPCASFDLIDPAQQRECFNWSNTQPLFAEDNLKKGANGG